MSIKECTEPSKSEEKKRKMRRTQENTHYSFRMYYLFLNSRVLINIQMQWHVQLRGETITVFRKPDPQGKITHGNTSYELIYYVPKMMGLWAVDFGMRKHTGFQMTLV